jgi:hypothetical protein
MHPHNNRTALTPVLSSGILICIAIAVSLATVAWMNGLPTPDVCTEKLEATTCQWGPNLSYIDVTLFNNGTQNVKLSSVTVNSHSVTVVYIAGSNQISSGESAIVRVANTFTSRATYQLAFQTVKGNRLVYTITA